MAQKNNNWIWWTIGAITLVGAGVGAYFIFKNPKKDKEKKMGDTQNQGQDQGTKDIVSDLNLNLGTSNTPSGGTTTTSTTGATPFKNQAEGDAFRMWVNTKYPDYAKEIDLDKSNPKYDNSTIRKAWAKYGAEYQQSLTSATNTATNQSGGLFGGLFGSTTTNNTLIGQYGTQIDNAKGWKKIQGGILTTQGLKKESTNSGELIYYIIDVPIKISDYVVHLYEIFIGTSMI